MVRAGLIDQQIEEEERAKKTYPQPLNTAHLSLGEIMPSILPNAETQFCDGNGAPLAGGQVYTYVVGTTTPKTTWQDPAGTVENANPITLDASGRTIIFGVGAYRQQVYDSIGNLIWDQVTAPPSLWDLNGLGYLVDTGVVNALAVTLPVAPAALSDLAGVALYVQVGNTNTGAATMNVADLGAMPITQGGAALGAGVLVAGALYPLVFTGSAWQLPGMAASAVTLAQLQNGSIGPTFGNTNTGTLTIAPTAGQTVDVQITDTGSTGVTVTLTGNGSVTPSKSIRVLSGIMQILNSAGSPIASIDDSGNLILAGTWTASDTPA